MLTVITTVPAILSSHWKYLEVLPYRGPNPGQICPDTASSAWVLDSVPKKEIRSMSPDTMRVLKLGTVKPGRAWHRRSNRRTCAGLPDWEVREKGALETVSGWGC